MIISLRRAFGKEISVPTLMFLITLSCFVMRGEHLQPVEIWDGHHSNVVLVYCAFFVVWRRVRFSEIEEARAEAVKSKIWGQVNPSNRGLCSLDKGILYHHKTLEFVIVKLWTRNSEYTHLLQHHILMLFSIDEKKFFSRYCWKCWLIIF